MLAFALFALIPVTTAIFFPFGGGNSGGCSCNSAPPEVYQEPQNYCPPPPPPCPPPCPPPPPPCLCSPPLNFPTLPPLKPFKLPTFSLPPVEFPILPPLRLGCPSLSTLPPLRIGCGRKKRASTNIVRGESGASDDALCNNKEIRKIILKNLNMDATLSKAAIHSELKAQLGGEFVVICSDGDFSFIADSSDYCIDGSASQTCYVLQI